MNYVIITENDISPWKDSTGREYHFPKRYLKYLTKGTVVIYYKGLMKNRSFASRRMTALVHYFGIAEIGIVKKDTESAKNDYYAEIINFKPFSSPVLAKQNGAFLENIPSTKVNNYWRDGVREIDKTTFDKIISLSDLNDFNATNDNAQGTTNAYTSSAEGNLKQTYSTRYERDPKLRERAIEIHGLTCMGCGFNFEKVYGEWGAGFIHVHHTKPLSDGEGERIVNAETDMIVLCPNCHYMIHRRKKKTLSLDELHYYLKLSNN
ncbi:HNH endonuclease [Sphingobacterium sp.]|uniref:HNH endonuclease n=1 Tax=Sphingobacterium sp. TaxID=341027 RepID=UPI0031D51CCA